MFMADTGSVEVCAYKEYIVQQLARGEMRSDGRINLTELRRPSILDENAASSTIPTEAGKKKEVSLREVENKEMKNVGKRKRNNSPETSNSSISSSHTTSSSFSTSSSCGSNNNNSLNRSEEDATTTAGAARFKKAGRLLSRLYTDDRGTCIHCELEGLLAPPPLRSRKEGRLTVHVACPFLRRSGKKMTSGGGEDLLKSGHHNALHSGDDDLGRRQLEGFLSSVVHRCMDMRQLCIIEGEACWLLAVTVSLWNVDGGLWGATLMAVVGALRALVLPRCSLPNGEVVEARQVQLTRTPLTCTYGVITVPYVAKRRKQEFITTMSNSKEEEEKEEDGTTSKEDSRRHNISASHSGNHLLWIADLTAAEEMVVDGYLTITLDEHDHIVEIRQIGQSIQGMQNTLLQHWRKAHAERRKQLGW